jgi:hypothetical protein
MLYMDRLYNQEGSIMGERKPLYDKKNKETSTIVLTFIHTPTKHSRLYNQAEWILQTALEGWSYIYKRGLTWTLVYRVPSMH